MLFLSLTPLRHYLLPLLPLRHCHCRPSADAMFSLFADATPMPTRHIIAFHFAITPCFCH
jgi:hypothetical protein